MTIERIAHYEILDRLSDRFVFKARDSRDGALVALKILPAWMNSHEALSRFEREIKVERAIEHVNLARFHDVGQAVVTDPELVGSASDGSGQARIFYLAREYVDGESLEAVLSERRLPLALALSVAIQIAQGLEVVHQNGIVHRNLNPSNIHVTAKGEVKILDFGLAKILKEEMAANRQNEFRTASGQLLGTAPFLAPEQIRGDKVDDRTDLFAVGVLLYHMITGEYPFPHSNLLEYFHAIDNEDPTPMSARVPEVPPQLDGIVARLLAKDPEERYAKASGVVADLAELLKSPQV